VICVFCLSFTSLKLLFVFGQETSVRYRGSYGSRSRNFSSLSICNVNVREIGPPVDLSTLMPRTGAETDFYIDYLFTVLK